MRHILWFVPLWLVVKALVYFMQTGSKKMLGQPRDCDSFTCMSLDWLVLVACTALIILLLQAFYRWRKLSWHADFLRGHSTAAAPWCPGRLDPGRPAPGLFKYPISHGLQPDQVAVGFGQ